MSIYINKDELMRAIPSEEINARMAVAYMQGIDIIRCNDCKWYCGHERYCTNDILAIENGYCYHAKKRTTENDDV